MALAAPEDRALTLAQIRRATAEMAEMAVGVVRVVVAEVVVAAPRSSSKVS